MFRKLLAAVRFGAAVPASNPQTAYFPYENSAANRMYNSLFCDDVAAFRPQKGQPPTPWQTALFSAPADLAALRALAQDPVQEGRLRYFGYARLRMAGEAVPPKMLLGVIVEVPLDGGLDVLAAFSEGGVRYINQSGKLAVFEGVADLDPLVHKLFAASEIVVSRIGPWDQPRREPPQGDSVRLSFLVSDGLYFGEGPLQVMQHEPMAGPVIESATHLLQSVVSMAGN